MNFFFRSVLISISLVICIFIVEIYAESYIEKICVADVGMIFKESNAEKDAKIKLEKRQREMSKTLGVIGEEIDELNEVLRRESAVMNKVSIAEKERELRIKINDLKLLKLKFQDELDNLQQELILVMEKGIIDVIKNIAKSEKYLIVVNKSALIYCDNNIDITEEVLIRYNEQYDKYKN